MDASPISPVVIEPIESRLFKSVSSWQDDYISDLSGASYFGAVYVGDNGDPWGYATTDAGTNDEPQVWSYITWDSNPDDGLDSGWRGMQLDVNTGGNGGGSWEVDSAGPGTFAASTNTVIHSVTLRAAVMMSQMQIDIASITVEFYHEGQIVETVHPDGVSASTMTSTTSDPREAIEVITPTASNCDGVSVAAVVRLQTAEGTYAQGADIFGQVLVS
jgi:hypothetical protein